MFRPASFAEKCTGGGNAARGTSGTVRRPACGGQRSIASAATEQERDVAPHPLRQFAVAVDRPHDQRAVVRRLHRSGETVHIALDEFALFDGALQQRRDARAHRLGELHGVVVQGVVAEVEELTGDFDQTIEPLPGASMQIAPEGDKEPEPKR